VFSPLHAYFLQPHGNGEVPVLGKLPYCSDFVSDDAWVSTVGEVFVGVLLFVIASP
jgi:hypothetical protein